MSHTFHSIKVKRKIQETEDACSFLFEISDELTEKFKFTAGQYVNLRVEIAGNEERRAYSIFTAPFESEFGITVKLVPDGKVSSYLINKINEGDSIDLMAPEGSFLLSAKIDERRDHYFIAAGSGITPIMSMIKTVLEEEPKSNAYLLYGNKSKTSVIFLNQINELKENYAGQFFVQHTMSQTKESMMGGIKGLFGKSKNSDGFAKGRIDTRMIKKFLDEHPVKSNSADYYLCGPGGLIKTGTDALGVLGVNDKNIHKEYFTPPEDENKSTEPNKNAQASGAASISGAIQVEVTLDGKTHQVEIDGKKTVLESLLDNNINAPYSCTSGACATCMAKMSEGKVEMDACFSLDDDEIKEGYILTCQARCQTNKLTINYDID